MCTFLSLSLTLTVFLHKFMLFIPKLKSFTMTLKIIFVSFWKFGRFSSVPRKRAGIQRKPSDKLKIGDPFQWYQWSIKSACSNGIACYRRIKRPCGYPFPFSTVLQRLSFLSLCQQPFAGALVGNHWRKMIIC